MIASHASQFSVFMFENSIKLYEELMEWLNLKNRDMQKLARYAVVSVLKVVRIFLNKNSGNSKDSFQIIVLNIFLCFYFRFQNIGN